MTKLNTKDLEKIVELRQKGLTLRQIASIFNVTNTAIYKRLLTISKYGIIDKYKNPLPKAGGRENVRERARIRDNHKCQDCRKKWKEGERRFDVHHIDGDSKKTRQCDNWEEEKDNLITLCHKCHFGRHYRVIPKCNQEKFAKKA